MSKRQRTENLLRGIAEIILIGGIYFALMIFTPFRIPCPIRLITGWRCPGCGISHYFIDMARLDFKAAYGDNQFVFIIMPLLLVYGAYRGYRYIRDDRVGFSMPETVAALILFISAIGFGVGRNII